MKKSFLFLTLLISLMSFLTIPVRNVSASTTITSADDGGVVTNTGGAVTFTLGTVSSGFSCTINNQGTGDITLSTAVTVHNGKTVTTIGRHSTEITSNGVGNKLRIYYDGTSFRSF